MLNPVTPDPAVVAALQNLSEPLRNLGESHQEVEAAIQKIAGLDNYFYLEALKRLHAMHQQQLQNRVITFYKERLPAALTQIHQEIADIIRVQLDVGSTNYATDDLIYKSQELLSLLTDILEKLPDSQELDRK